MIINNFEKKQIKQIILSRNANTFNIINFNILKPGQTIEVTYFLSKSRNRKQTISGKCISVKKKNLISSILLRTKILGTNLEHSFLYYSPLLVSITIKNTIKTRKQKLYYLRKK